MSSLYKDITLREDVAGCLLCRDAPCTKACPYMVEVDKIIRSLRFENKAGQLINCQMYFLVILVKINHVRKLV